MFLRASVTPWWNLTLRRLDFERVVGKVAFRNAAIVNPDFLRWAWSFHANGRFVFCPDLEPLRDLASRKLNHDRNFRSCSAHIIHCNREHKRIPHRSEEHTSELQSH